MRIRANRIDLLRLPCERRRNQTKSPKSTSCGEPENVAILGITSYFRKYIKDYAKISKPLSRLIKQRKHEDSFDEDDFEEYISDLSKHLDDISKKIEQIWRYCPRYVKKNDDEKTNLSKWINEYDNMEKLINQVLVCL